MLTNPGQNAPKTLHAWRADGFEQIIHTATDEGVTFFHNCWESTLAHRKNARTRMPGIHEQLAIAQSRISDLMVARALLKRGWPYEDAVRMFSPYTRCRRSTGKWASREIVDVAMVDGVPAFVFVNSRLEENSPGTIVVITD